MRVTHLAPTWFDSQIGILGGAERYVLELARHMAEVVPTSLVTFGTKPAEFSVGKLAVRVLGDGFHVRGQRTNPFSVTAVREGMRADILHIHQTHLLLSSALALLRRATRRPIFATDLGGGGWDLSAFVDTTTWFTGHLHISEYSRRVFGHANYPAARVILGGVDSTKFAPGPGGDGVLFVGRLLPHKGVDVLIRALPTDMRLTVVGTAIRQDYAQLLRDLGTAKQVRFIENASDLELAAFYAAADVLVLPSVYTDCYGETTVVPELLGQTILEAMASAIPVVATRVASLPELVDDQVSGYLVEPNNVGQLRAALEFLRDNPGCARMMGAAGRVRALGVFSWDATVGRCLEAYSIPRGKSPTI